MNVIGTLNILLSSRDSGVRRVVFASSSSIYGADPRLPKREDGPTMPISPYAVAKQAGEGYCRSFSQVYGLETVSLRYFNVFGPRQDPLSQYAAVIPRFITALLEGEPPSSSATASSPGTSPISTTWSRRTCSPPKRADVSGQTFNIACGERISLNRLLDDLRGIIGSEVEATYLEAQPGDVKHSLADISSAREQLGYEPLVSFGEGVRRTVEHLRSVAATGRAGPLGAATR